MFLQDTNKYFYDATYYNGQVYTVSNIAPTVFKDEYGYDDDGSGISFEYWTKAFDEGEYTMKKCYWESRLDCRISELASLTQEIYTDSEINIYGDVFGTLIDTKTINNANFEPAIGGIGTQ